MNMRDRPQPGRVVQRAGANRSYLGASVALTVDPATALGAKPIGTLHAAGADPAPRLGFAAHDSKRIRRDRHRQAKSTPRPTLTLSAVTGIDKKRHGADRKANRLTWTAALQRELGWK